MASNLKLVIDSEGIATVTIDVPGRSMNPISPALETELAQVLDEVKGAEAVRGLLITSAKQSFIPGYDLAEIEGQFERQRTLAEGYAANRHLSLLYRRLETCGKPVAAAINGLAMGGGLELCLACHYRVLADDPRAVLSFPEVKVGLLPGAGGTQRLPRLIGLEKSLPLLLEGRSIKPPEALKLGIVHAVVPAGEVAKAARQWLLGNPTAQQPWDRPGFRVPGGANIAVPAIGALFAGATALVAKNTQRNYPAPLAILSCVFEGAQLPIDLALRLESKYFTRLMLDPVARNLVRTTFINKGKADRLIRRPPGVPSSQVRTLGILGAGMMGGGIAYVSAAAGIDCVLLDTRLDLAEKGRGYAATQLRKDLEKGRTTQARLDEILARIKATAEYGALKACDLVIEAVFENRAVKADATRKAEAAIPASALFASNTSTLPITGLAQASSRPEQFIGLHFFSPVDRMPLVEVIVGKRTSADSLARALDYVAQLGKTPIVVNDSRGFYTSRVFGTFCYEGQRMLEEGINPVLIENGARAAGMPVGPLAVTDEVALELQYKAILQSREDLGDEFVEPISWGVLRHFVEDLKRLGRKSGGGFYDYPQGGRKHLWPGLRTEYPLASEQPPIAEISNRLLYIQALESARCLEEGVLSSAAEADLGAVLGWGFPSYTGGTLSFIDMVGAAAFVTECERLQQRHGERFRPTPGLLERARSGARFHAEGSGGA
jgi:3-hydroxyacyl-CoA dehydrogenase/enoyl-CoA hydratase/3-hydroxybutyryl-CoA epimerase